jgi:hypothetical protein
MKPWTAAELRAGGVVWLLELAWAGQTWRFASRPVVVATDAGDELAYAEGAVPEVYREEADLFASTTTPTSVGFDGLVFDEDVAELVARGHWLELATAEISQWVEGRTWEERRVVLTGRVREPEYGAAGEPVSFSVAPTELDESALVPPSSAAVSDATWPNAAESAQGAAYPFVIGRPGLGLSTDLASTGGAPALLVHLSSRYLLIAGHRVRATSVTVIGITQGEAASFAVTHRSDGLGRTVATVTLDAAAGSGQVAAVDGDEYSVDWSGTSGGMASLEDADEALTGAGEVCEWLLRESGLPHDVGAWAALRSSLGAWRLDFYVDQPQGPFRLLQEAVLPLVPVSVRRGARGIEPVLWPVDATAADAVAQLVQGRNVDRDGPVEHVDPPVANEFRVTYAPRWGGEPFRTLTFTGDETVAGDDPTVAPFGACVSSRSVWGPLVGEPIDTRVVQRPEVAARTLAWRAQAYAHPWRVLQYVAIDAELAVLRPGDLVTVTDADLHLTDHVGLVRGVEWEGEVVTIGVVLLFVPSRDPIPV